MAGKSGEILDAADHPVTFLVAVTIGVISLTGIFSYIAKRSGMAGLGAWAGNG